MSDRKPGKVLRVDPTLHKFLTERRKGREPWSAVLRRELGLKPRRGKPEYATLFALASDLYKEKGELILAAARRRITEKDLRVRKVKEIK